MIMNSDMAFLLDQMSDGKTDDGPVKSNCDGCAHRLCYGFCDIDLKTDTGHCDAWAKKETVFGEVCNPVDELIANRNTMKRRDRCKRHWRESDEFD